MLSFWFILIILYLFFLLKDLYNSRMLFPFYILIFLLFIGIVYIYYIYTLHIIDSLLTHHRYVADSLICTMDNNQGGLGGPAGPGQITINYVSPLQQRNNEQGSFGLYKILLMQMHENMNELSGHDPQHVYCPQYRWENEDAVLKPTHKSLLKNLLYNHNNYNCVNNKIYSRQTQQLIVSNNELLGHVRQKLEENNIPYQ